MTVSAVPLRGLFDGSLTTILTDSLLGTDHRDRINKMHEANNISITKVTHATRPYATQTARENGASVTATKALGGWSESGAYRNCYDRALPVEAMLGAAMFNARKPETHHLVRDCLRASFDSPLLSVNHSNPTPIFSEPPQELSSEIFPFIEAEEAALRAREKANHFARDIALKQLLRLFTWFRRVLLQDAALHFVDNPHAAIFKYPPFNTPAFREFASGSTAAIAAAEQQARLALQNLPRQMEQSMRGILATNSLEMQQMQNTHQAELQGVREEVSFIRSALEILAGPKRRRQSRESGMFFWIFIMYSLASRSAGFNTISPSPTPPLMMSRAASPSQSPLVLVPTPPSLPSPPAPVNMDDIVSPAPAYPCPAHTSEIMAAPVDLDSPCLSPPPSSSPLPTTPLTTPDIKWKQYLERFGEATWKTHAPQWINGDWLPMYEYQPAVQITDYWTEWTLGLGGYLPVRVLTEVWDARWRRNVPKLRTESGRRMKVVNLILELSKKPQWGVNLALRFIAEKYEPVYKPRAFADYLTRNHAQVLAAADLYPRK